MIQRNDCPIEFPTTSVRISIGTLKEEIKTMVTEKYEFENRETTKLIPRFNVFELSTYRGEGSQK